LSANEKKSPSLPWSVRSTDNRDRSLVANLLSSAPDRHLHLDWYTTYELLDEDPSLIAFDDDRAVAILACPPDPAGIGWIRYFAVSEGNTTQPLWDLLWEKALAIAPTVNISTISALVTQSWFTPILRTEGFIQNTEVIFFEWQGNGIQVDLPQHATLRTMTSDDLETVSGVDQKAFLPLWQHSLRALTAAFHLSSFATVVEVKQKIVAYQICTASALGAHLARLAVEPGMQDQGLAKALVIHAIRHFQQRGIHRMSVNTQADNSRSQFLYEKLGFTLTGQRFPVLTFNI
jgi:ribosomal protein S18 acetylase RimI-like enzyme